MKKIFFGLLIVILILLALFPRMVEVLNGNPVFLFDQGRDYLAVKNIVVDHKWTLIGAELGSGSAGISYIFQGPGYFYLLSIPFILFHGNPVGGVWFMLAFGLASIALGFYFGKKLWGIWGGFLIAFLLSVSPQIIPQSRFTWSPYPSTFFILLIFFFLYAYLKNKKLRFLFLATFFSGFIYNFELAIAVPLCVTLFLFSLFVIRKHVIGYVYLFSGFILAFLPMIFFEMRHHFMGMHSLGNYLLSHHNTNSHFILTQHIADEWGAFLYNFANTFVGNGFIPALLFLLIFAVGLFYVVKNEKDGPLRAFIIYLITLFVVNFVVFTQLRNSIYNYYLTDLNIAYIFLFSYIFITSVKLRKTILTVLFGILLICFFVGGIINSVHTSIRDYGDYGGTAKLKGKIDAIDYIYKDAKGKPFGLFIFSPPVYTFPYDYILWWHGESSYHYLPTQTKNGIFYLLIEPDSYKPWSYKGWLETVIKSGKIIYTKTLPSGFIVQKREE